MCIHLVQLFVISVLGEILIPSKDMSSGMTVGPYRATKSTLDEKLAHKTSVTISFTHPKDNGKPFIT